MNTEFIIKEGLLGFAILLTPVGLTLVQGERWDAGIAVLLLVLIALGARAIMKLTMPK